MIPAAHLTYLWQQVVNPRLGCAYVWGGSFDANDVTIGTDCSGAVSAELCALIYGSAMPWQRQFFTGTFAGANPGDHGPFGGVDCTKDLVCIAHPSDAPFGTAMIIAVRQEPDPTDAHMIASVPTAVGAPWTTIEMGGPPNNFHLGVTAIDDPEFNQWFYLPGPIEGAAPVPVPAPPSQADQYASAVIQTGQHMGVTPRGIQIALATVFVESDWLMYANSNDPASLQLPHDAVGSDHMSVGLFQQQNFAPWPDLACRMDAACSAGAFYGQLVKLDYNNTANSPGSYAQAVQGSAFPDRYDQRFQDAVDLYNRLAAAPPLPTPHPPIGPLMPPSDADWQDLLDKVRQIWGALFTPIPSKSRYANSADLWATKDLIRNDDEFLYDLITEHDAALGDAAALARVNAAAARGDRIAQAFLAKLGAAQPASPPVPAMPNVTLVGTPAAAPVATSTPTSGAGITTSGAGIIPGITDTFTSLAAQIQSLQAVIAGLTQR